MHIFFIEIFHSISLQKLKTKQNPVQQHRRKSFVFVSVLVHAGKRIEPIISAATNKTEPTSDFLCSFSSSLHFNAALQVDLTQNVVCIFDGVLHTIYIYTYSQTVTMSVIMAIMCTHTRVTENGRYRAQTRTRTHTLTPTLRHTYGWYTYTQKKSAILLSSKISTTSYATTTTHTSSVFSQLSFGCHIGFDLFPCQYHHIK